MEQSEMEKMKCFSCGQEIDGLFVTTPHRVVGKEIDVIGGPKETLHPDCAGRKIFELRGHMSDLLNPRASQSAVVFVLATDPELGVITGGGKLPLIYKTKELAEEAKSQFPEAASLKVVELSVIEDFGDFVEIGDGDF